MSVEMVMPVAVRVAQGTSQSAGQMAMRRCLIAKTQINNHDLLNDIK